jgi:hypothetical protein
MQNRFHGRRSGRVIALAGLVAAAALVGAPQARASDPPEPDSQTFAIVGQELTGETRTLLGDGSVRTVLQAGVNGLLYDVEDQEHVLARAVVKMSITVNENVLEAATVTYTQLGPHAVSVTVPIDPCWFEYVNDRDATAREFGADVVRRIEEQSPPGALEPCVKEWLGQRLSLLGARTAEPYVKRGIVLVPPAS